MGIRTVIILSILAMLFGIIILFVWADQRRQQKRLRAVARQNRDNRERSRSTSDPLLSEPSGNSTFDDGILSAPRIVSQATSPNTSTATNAPSANHRPPTPPTGRIIQATSTTSTTTRTPRITPYPTPPFTQTPGYKAAQSAARLQAIKQKPLNPKFVPQNLTLNESTETSDADNSTVVELASAHLTLQITEELKPEITADFVEEEAMIADEYSTEVFAEEQEIQESTTSVCDQSEDTELYAEQNTGAESESQPTEEKSCELPPYITFSILADSNKSFGGYDLLQAILGCGLRHGEREIFHRYDSKNPERILFSLASIAKPGTFSLETIGAFSTPGLIFIFEIERTPELLNSFELLLQSARQLNDELDGNLLDDQRQPLTTERIQTLREQLREITPVADSIDDN